MNLLHTKKLALYFMVAALAGVTTLSSCKKDDPVTADPPKKSKSYTYAFNTGQLGATTAYAGTHDSSLTATLLVEEIDAAKSRITITLNNTMNGEEYMVHAHDAADPATTPNGTPYNESPNVNVLVTHIHGNGGSVSASQEATMSFDAITTQYNGFLVVHDPTQAISTVDLTTYLVVGVFAR